MKESPTMRAAFLLLMNKKDLGKFKTPGLRNIAITPPYMHDGIFKKLEQAGSYYKSPFMFVAETVNIVSAILQPLGLTQQEKKDLVSFLKTFTDKA